MADVDKYLGRITSEHRKPLFEATISAIVGPLAEIAELVGTFPTLYDLDTAVGAQLDVVGQWIGLTRQVRLPISGIYFSFDVTGLGFDEGVWYAPGDDTTSLFSLPDDAYRLLLKARALNNAWDGSIDQAYAIWAVLLAGTGRQILIFDNGDLTMSLGLVSDPPPDAITTALFVGGYLDIRPAGVRVREYLIPTAVGKPFALDAPPPVAFAGLDEGVWTNVYTL